MQVMITAFHLVHPWPSQSLNILQQAREILAYEDCSFAGVFFCEKEIKPETFA